MKKIITSLILISSLNAANFVNKIEFKDKKEAIDTLNKVFDKTFVADSDLVRDALFGDEKDKNVKSLEIEKGITKNIKQPIIFTKRFTTDKNGKKIDRWASWQIIINGIDDFIKKAAGSDKDLLKPLEIATAVNNDIMNNLKVIYNGNFYALRDITKEDKAAAEKLKKEALASLEKSKDDIEKKFVEEYVKANKSQPDAKTLNDFREGLKNAKVSVTGAINGGIVQKLNPENAKQVKDSLAKLHTNSLPNLLKAENMLNKATFIKPSKRSARDVLKAFILKLIDLTDDAVLNLQFSI